MRVEILGFDYLEFTPPSPGDLSGQPMRFQQDVFRLWYQIDGTGILQNRSRNVFGTARPGLLGVMERSQRYTYLHQKGTFECFQMLFSLLPSQHARCYWNSEIEGKTVLDGNERRYFENLVFDLFLVITNRQEFCGLSSTSRLIEILVLLFKKGLLVIEDTQFPKNKRKSLVAKAKRFMELHYGNLRHQQSLEQECGVDINYLNIIFRKETGVTLFGYLTNIRMEHAKHLLETGRETIAAVAAGCGYPNANSFSRAFRRHERCSPLDFRRRSGSGSLPPR